MSHKFRDQYLPEHKLRIKLASTRPAFLKTGAAQRTALRTVSSFKI